MFQPSRSLVFRLVVGLLISTLLVVPTIAAHSGGTLPLAFPDGHNPAALVAQDEEDSEIVLSAAADAHVQVEHPSENFGAMDRLVVDAGPRSEAFLRFDVSGLHRPVERVTLRLWVTDGTYRIPSLRMSSNITWEEATTTWNTRPAYDERISRGEEAVESESWLEYDVTLAISGNGSYTFYLDPESNDRIDLASRESFENRPELVIETASPVSGTPNPVLDEDGHPVILAAGDIGGCDWDTDEATAKILDEEPGPILTLGDNDQGQGSLQEFTDCFVPTWGRHKDRIHPVPGNHDYGTYGAEPYYTYYGDAAGEQGRGYYSFDIGDWHIVALNSNIDVSRNSEQLAWLEQDLEANASACTLAYWHHPRFSSGARHGSNDDFASFWDVLYKYGADIVLSGHEHQYERIAPMNPDGDLDEAHGIRQFVVGTGGANLRPEFEPLPHSEVRNGETHGVLRMSLQPDGYSWEFLPIDGLDFTDSGSTACTEAPAEEDIAGATPQADPQATPETETNGQAGVVAGVADGILPNVSTPNTTLARLDRKVLHRVNRVRGTQESYRNRRP